MTDYSDFVQQRAADVIERTEPSEAELAEAAERAERNRLQRIMDTPTAAPLPATQLQRAGEAPSGEYTTRKWVRSRESALIKAMVPWVLTRIEKAVAPLRQEVEQQGRVNEALGRQVDKILNELSELKREAALAKRLADQNDKRRRDLLEMENSLLRAGRRPAEQDVGEAELPQFLGNGHAAQ